ncbi:PqiC family protein [Salinicola aestuarinus]|uniref:PqiC family protein n=1 Tax=Salinicola aestuarinus TaxID=1949082 RepID=UPI001CB6E4BB|nr:ABC-type transport auxiliary lipoprotein family protein [Salinicola aestuarinus]
MMTSTVWRRTGAAVLFTLGTLALAGCASQSTPSSRYTLPEAPGSSAGAVDASDAALVIRPVQVASYLNQEGIVMQLSDIELNAANQNLWAEPLGKQLTRRLGQSLSSRLAGTTVVAAGQSVPGAVELSVSVERFQGRYDGEAVAAGEWQLFDEGRLIAQREFNVTRPLTADGYPALVRTLGDAWREVANEIAQGVEQAR